ncbi:MAG: flagellar basal-body rod protein FlgF [bacterium]|nr:flagellar basal-body rod protein FlgF [bacterium]
MYTSASGMIPRVQQQEAIANNIANAATAGFKKDDIFVRELSKAERKTTKTAADWMQPMVTKAFTQHTHGSLDRTNNPLDLAIDGEGFFRLQSPDGVVALTRSGSFQVANNGFLNYPGGYQLMGESGPIQVGTGTVTIAQSGEVEVDGTVVGRVVPYTVADLKKLEKVGETLFVAAPGAELTAVPTPSIQQGYLESSNVDVITEMVDMIVSYRIYEANAKSLQTQDSSLDSLFNRVAGSK